MNKIKFYASILKYPHRKALPIIEKGWTQETEYPYRESRYCLVFRVPFTKPGFVLGIWGKPALDGDSAIYATLGARQLSDKEWDEIFALGFFQE